MIILQKKNFYDSASYSPQIVEAGPDRERVLEPQRPGDARQQLVLAQQRHAVHTLDVRHEVVVCNGGREFNTFW